MLYTIKFLNTNQEYEVYPKFKIIEKFTTDLDVFEFTLKPLENELDLDFKKYNGFIPMILSVNNVEYKYMYLTNYKQTIVTYKPNIYKYVIQATSPTFKLQRIDLPNKLITQPINENKRTVFEEFIKILEVYGNNEFGYNGNLESLLDVPCPEMSFTKSTFHEVLIALFGVCGLAPKMTNFRTIDYIDLKAINANNWNSEDVFIRYEKSNSLENYSDCLDYDVENAISDKNVVSTQWLASTSEEALVTDDNFIWKMPSDIYEIVNVKLRAEDVFLVETKTDQPVTLGLYDIDITDYVIPKEVYETLLTSSAVIQKDKNYKRNNLYFENNIIGGGGFTESSWVASIQTQRALFNIIDLVIEDYRGYILVEKETNLRKYYLKVTYKPKSSNSRFKTIKSGVEIPINSMIDNQNDAYIDVVEFGKQKQELINRLGNEVVVAQANFDLNKINNIYDLQMPLIGDRINENYIVTQLEMQFNENNILANYYLAKDYVFLTAYSGLNQIKRFTSIDTKNTLIRNDVFLQTYKLEFLEQEENNDLNGVYYLNYGTKKDYGVSMHLLTLKDKNGNLIPKTKIDPDKHFPIFVYILVNSENKQIGDSILSSFKFESNVKVGDMIVNDLTTHLKEPVKYTDNNGEFRTLTLYFGEGEFLRDETNFSIVRKFPTYETESLLKPDGSSLTKYGLDLLLNKDNREITSITLQFRTVGDNENIIVYNDFAKYSQLISHEELTPRIYLQHFKNENEFNENKYEISSIFPKGEYNERASVNFNRNNIQLTITGLSTYDDMYWTIGVCDQYDNLLFALNYKKQNTLPIINLYLNKI